MTLRILFHTMVYFILSFTAMSSGATIPFAMSSSTLASFFIPSATSNLAMWCRPNEKADLHHIKWRREWKLWGCQRLQWGLAPGILLNSCPWLNPLGLQEIIDYRGAHPHGVNAWLPPESCQPWKSSKETPFLTQREWKEWGERRKTNNDEVIMCTGVPTLPNTVLWPPWNPWWPDKNDKKPCLHINTASRPFRILMWS